MNAVVLEGLAECLLSTILFGTSYVPIKKYEFGDGIFSLQIRCISILCLGFVTFAYTGFIHFYPLVLLGGFIWTLANMIVLPCIGELGIGLAVLLYSFSNCVTNWVTGNYGLFWTNARPPTNTLLNYTGLAGLLIGGALITFVRPEKTRQKLSAISTLEILPKSEDTTPIKTNNKINVKRILAIVFSLIAGFLFGEDPTPVIIVQDRYPNAPKDGLYYIFSFFSGIFLSSSIIFTIYCVIKKNKPFVNNELVLPSLISGVMWAFAQGLFIISMGHLSVSVAGPIASVMPGCVASCWSVFYFKEIKGKKNLILLASSMFLASLGTILITISK